MAHGYNTRAQDGLANPYTTLPGTSNSINFVTFNWTPMKARMNAYPGSHPARWVYELVNNSFIACHVFQRARDAGGDYAHVANHTHGLVVNGNQNYSTPDSRVLSAVCLHCHFHFVFKIKWDEKKSEDLCNPNQQSWPIQDNMFPWHHLTWAGSDSEVNIARDSTKYYPVVAREYFVCSCQPCTLSLQLEISKPRLPPSLARKLLDHHAILEQLQVAREREASRYEGATDRWAHEAPMNLNTYLKNQLECEPGKSRPISKRNKRFAVLFGPRCFDLFQLLEYEEEIIDRDGVDEGSFKPVVPAPPGGPNSATELGTYRAFVEDVRSEVQCIIQLKSQTEGQQPENSPSWALPALLMELQAVIPPEIDSDPFRKALENPAYAALGVLPSQGKEIIAHAYHRQWELCPHMRKEIMEGLTGVAEEYGDEELQIYASSQSSLYEQLSTQPTDEAFDDGIVPQALDFFDLRKSDAHSAETIIRAFRGKLAADASNASFARQMMLIIAKARSEDVAFHDALLLETQDKLTFPTAMAVLGLPEASTEIERHAIRAAKTKITSSKSTEEKLVYLDALDSLVVELKSSSLKHESITLRQMNGVSASNINTSSVVDFALPVGLNNIGNTCYLNSLLQYLFTLKPIRDIALHHDAIKLELTDEAIASRRLGGNKMEMDRGEAVVAQAFTQELGTLFRNLESSDQAATRPSQRLANAVLLSTHTLLEASKQWKTPEPSVPQAVDNGSQPPPLPARPSHMPAQGTQYSVTPLDKADGNSDASGETLVQETGSRDVSITTSDPSSEDLPGSSDSRDVEYETITVAPAALTNNGDTVMKDAEESVDQKVLRALEHQTRISGTDQQDVEEVMGSILNRLQAAIRPNSVDESSGIQRESIMDTFFVTTVNYTKKFDDSIYQSEVSFDRSITAFPAPHGSCSLYEALGRNFDQQILEESKLTRYTAIRSLPPVLHILIQRSQNIGKNTNSVIIPETLYLDRYMDHPQDSEEFKQRVEEWALAHRIADIKSMISRAVGPQKELKLPDSGSLSETDGEPNDFEPEETWDFDGPMDDGFVKVQRPDFSDDFAEKPVHMADTARIVRQMMDDELKEHETTLGKHYDGLKGVAYRLHAVICHSGNMKSGHYWVYIHDFEQNIWRKYNDETVTEHPVTADVLHELNSGGQPYYLCYIKDGAQDDFVDVPRRERPEHKTDLDSTPKDETERTMGLMTPPADEEMVDVRGPFKVEAPLVSSSSPESDGPVFSRSLEPLGQEAQSQSVGRNEQLSSEQDAL